MNDSEFEALVTPGPFKIVQVIFDKESGERFGVATAKLTQDVSSALIKFIPLNPKFINSETKIVLDAFPQFIEFIKKTEPGVKKLYVNFPPKAQSIIDGFVKYGFKIMPKQESFFSEPEQIYYVSMTYDMV